MFKGGDFLDQPLGGSRRRFAIFSWFCGLFWVLCGVFCFCFLFFWSPLWCLLGVFFFVFVCFLLVFHFWRLFFCLLWALDITNVIFLFWLTGLTLRFGASLGGFDFFWGELFSFYLWCFFLRWGGFLGGLLLLFFP